VKAWQNLWRLGSSLAYLSTFAMSFSSFVLLLLLVITNWIVIFFFTTTRWLMYYIGIKDSNSNWVAKKCIRIIIANDSVLQPNIDPFNYHQDMLFPIGIIFYYDRSHSKWRLVFMFFKNVVNVFFIALKFRVTRWTYNFIIFHLLDFKFL
jgi:hypothetical protein